MTEPVDIEFRINDQELAQASQRAVDSILGINSAGEQTIKTLKNRISEQKLLIKSVEQDVRELTKAYEEMDPGRDKDELGSGLKYVKRALGEDKDFLKELEAQLDAANEASKRQLNDQMSKLKMAGQQDTEQFRQLATEAGVVEQAIREVNKQTTLLGKSDANFQGIVSGVSGLAGMFSAGAGAMSLFGTESKDLQQVQTRLQALMAITIGLQQTYNTLNKDSAFRITTVTNAKRLWASAQKLLNTQLGIGAGLSKALMVSGIGLLLAGIAALVNVYNDWKKKQAEVNRLQEEFRNIEVETAKSMADQSVKVHSLITVAENYNNSLKSRNEAIRQLKEIMPGYNAYIDQEGTLIGDTDDALKNYLATLYKVEKAKKIISDITKGQGDIEELKTKGITTEDVSIWDKLKVAGLNIFNKDRGTREWQAAVEKTFNQTLNELEDGLVKKETELKGLLEDDSVFSALFGDKKHESKLQKDAEKSAKEQQETQERINEEMRKLVEKNTSDRVALMDEGTQKELATIRDRYNKTIAEIKRQEAAWRKDQGGNLTAEQEVVIKDTKHVAASTAVKEEDEINKKLLEKYQDYAEQRKAIEEKFNKDIKALEDQRKIANEQGNSEMVESLDRAIAKAMKEKGKSLISFDFNVFKESPEYVRAFEDLKNTSTATLTSLMEQLEMYKGKAAESLDPAELQMYTAILQSIINELAARDPFGALANSQNKLTQATKKLAEAKKKLAEAEDSGDAKKITEAQKEYKEALDNTAKAANDAQKAQKKVVDVIDKLYDAIDGVGDAIGGTAGEVLNFIADIGRFVSTIAEGITTTGETVSKTVAMIEKASAILFIIQMAIQLISKLQSFIKDSHQQYLDFSKEIAQVNALRQAVTDYEIAVTKAKQAQDAWFGDDSLKNIRNEWKLNQQYATAYFDKVDEQQATYVNEKGGGWWNKWGKAVIETTTRFAHGDTLGGIESFVRNQDKYDKGMTRAVDNLRIETKAKTSGFLGIGGKGQKTEDLRTWAERNGFGQLFDENDIIDISVAEAILEANEKGTIKLVGETEETLETLVEYQKLYEEYQEQLQEYVNSLYAPLMDNFVDALWAWYDEGTDALDSFKEYASDTFRDIVTDMMKTIILRDVVGTYADDVAELYNQYGQGKLTEDELMAAVTKRTNQLANDYESALPTLQGMLTNIGAELSGIGIDIQKPSDDTTSSQQAEQGFHTSVSQDSFNEWIGQFVAIRIHTSNIYGLIVSVENETRIITGHLSAIERNTQNTVEELIEVNTRLKRLETEGVRVK